MEQETLKSSPATSKAGSKAIDTLIDSIEAALTYHLEDMTRATNEYSAGEEQVSEHHRAGRSVAATKADDATSNKVMADHIELQSKVAELEKSLAFAKADLETTRKNVAATKEESVKATESASGKTNALRSIIVQRKATCIQKEESNVAKVPSMARDPARSVNTPS
jgi:hypothetical protein